MSTTLPTVVAPTPKLGGSFLQNLGAPVLPGSALELNFLATGISHLIDNALNGIVVTGDELNFVHLGGVLSFFHKSSLQKGGIMDSFDIMLGGAGPASPSSALIHIEKLVNDQGFITLSKTISFSLDWDTGIFRSESIRGFDMGSKNMTISNDWHDGAFYGGKTMEDDITVTSYEGMGNVLPPLPNVDLVGVPTPTYDVPMIKM